MPIIPRQQGYGLIDCSVMVGGGKGYLSEAIAEGIWPQQPVGIENEHYGYAAQKNTWGDGSKYLNALEEYHASYARIHWWPDEFFRGNGKDLSGNKELVDQMNRRLGYRLQLLEASWPKQVEAGSTARFDFLWRNGGVAPCYRGGNPAITLTDATGKAVATEVDGEFNVRSLGVGRYVLDRLADEAHGRFLAGPGWPPSSITIRATSEPSLPPL